VVADDRGIDDYALLLFSVPCDTDGNPTWGHEFDLNAKSGDTYNHEKLWEGEIKGNPARKPLFCPKTVFVFSGFICKIRRLKALVFAKNFERLDLVGA
jgi:hypothetical protein